MEKPTTVKKPIKRYAAGIWAILFLCFAFLALGLLFACAFMLNARDGAAIVPHVPAADSLQRVPENAFYKADHALSVQELPEDARALSGSELYQHAANSVVDILVLTSAMAEWQTAGTGIIMSEDGYIVTSAYIVQDALYCKAVLASGDTLSAQLVGSDNYSGLAVVHVEASGLVPASFAATDSAEIGERVLSIGAAGGSLSGTLTEGIVAGLGRKASVLTGEGVFHLSDLIQMNKALGGANYGGALFNRFGQVIGICTPYGDGSGSEAGFAIPIGTAKPIIDSLLHLGFVPRAALGVRVRVPSAEEQYFLQLPINALVIDEISPDSLLAQAGVKAGDAILALNGVETKTTAELVAAVQMHQAGDAVEVLVCTMPDRKIQTLRTTLLEANHS